MVNYWSEFEYNKLKLLLKYKKVNSIFDVMHGNKELDVLPPVSVELHLTDNCNLNCPWCTDGLLRKNLASQKKEHILNLFNYLAKNKIGVTIEGGGEPSVYKYFDEIVQYGHSIGLDMGLISNGVKDFSSLIKYFKWVRISLDASNEEQYKIEKGFNKYETVLKNLKNFSINRNSLQTHLGIGYVLTSRNIDGLLDNLNFLNTINIDYIYIRPVEENPEICPPIEVLYDLKKEIVSKFDNARLKVLFVVKDRYVSNNDGLPCVAHSLTAVINANGNVVLCEKRRHDPITLGSLHQSNFNDIWNSDVRKKVSKKLLDEKNQIGCDVCRITSFNRMFHDVTTMHTSNFI